VSHVADDDVGTACDLGEAGPDEPARLHIEDDAFFEDGMKHAIRIEMDRHTGLELPGAENFGFRIHLRHQSARLILFSGAAQ